MDSRNTDQRIHLTAYSSPQVLTLAVSGEVDFQSAEPLRLALAAASRLDGAVSVDLSAVVFADTALVNALLRAQLDLGERLRIAAPSRPVLRLLRLLGLDRVFVPGPPPAGAPHSHRIDRTSQSSDPCS